MKQSNILVIVMFAVLMVVGWGFVLLAPEDESMREYEFHMDAAKEYTGRGLYQKAIEEYQYAVAFNNTEMAWAQMLEAYELLYQENGKIFSQYLDAAEDAAEACDNVEFILILANLYERDNAYGSAYKCLRRALEEGEEDVRVQDMLTQIRYGFDVKWNSYTDMRPCGNGDYAVSRTGIWTYLSEDGMEESFGNLEYAGPVGEEGIRYIRGGGKGKLIDGNQVIQGFVEFVPDEAGVFSEELIAMKDGDSYGYYNILGDKQLGDYDMAGTFCNGKAAVKEGNNWFLINSDGERTSSSLFENIVLGFDQKYLNKGIMLAEKGGQYSFYNDMGEQISDFICEDIDIITDDGMAAFCKGGKWGYVDLQGKEVIGPQFERAKSFSNGLGAVYNGELWGFINKEGKLVIDYQFINVDYFNAKGMCMVQLVKDRWQLLSLHITE